MIDLRIRAVKGWLFMSEKITSRLRMSSLWGVLGLVLIGIVGLGASNLFSHEKPALRVVYNQWPGYEFISLAKELGYFEDEGLEIKLVKVSSLADARRNFERGNSDVLAASMAELIYLSTHQSNQVQAIAVVDYSKGADVLLARPEISSLTELKGRRVAVEPHSLDVVNLGFALQSAGLALGDVTMVPLPQTEILRAVQNQEVDAAQTYPPYSLDLQRGGLMSPVFDTSSIPEQIVDVLITDANCIRNRRADLTKLVRAFFRAQRYYLEHPQDGELRMAKIMGFSPEEMREVMNGVGLIPLTQQPMMLSHAGRFVSSLEQASAQLTSAGLKQLPLDWNAYVTDSIVREVTK